MKYTVFKNEDLKNIALWRPFLYKIFELVRKEIKDIRELDDKKDNTYIVINTDEPYAEEVIDIMKRHGHWEEE